MKKLLLEKVGDYEVNVHLEDNKLIFHEQQDGSDVAKAAKILSDSPPGKEFRHLARIPMGVLNQAVREGWLHDPKAWKKWYMKSENRDFRVHAGRNPNFHAGKMLVVGGE